MMSDDPVLAWVKSVNAIARELDEQYGAIHPSGWQELSKQDYMKRLVEKYKRKAKQATT